MQKMKSKTYEEFVEKFKPKKTTDDCYTPEEIYQVIKDWVCKRYNVNLDDIIRPFWPGADYKNTEYPEGCFVLDNPPFSIFAEICQFYLERNIPFFLFAPALTILSSRSVGMKMNHIICDTSITYENGAVVKTSFVTNCNPDTIIETAPDLSKLIDEKAKELKNRDKKQLPKYEYPMNVLTATMCAKYARHGIDFKISKNECTFIRQLDSQKEYKKTIYGNGLLLSKKATEKKIQAEKRMQTEKESAEEEKKIEWQLSDREKEIIDNLDC